MKHRYVIRYIPGHAPEGTANTLREAQARLAEARRLRGADTDAGEIEDHLPRHVVCPVALVNAPTHRPDVPGEGDYVLLEHVGRAGSPGTESGHRHALHLYGHTEEPEVYREIERASRAEILARTCQRMFGAQAEAVACRFSWSPAGFPADSHLPFSTSKR